MTARHSTVKENILLKSGKSEGYIERTLPPYERVENLPWQLWLSWLSISLALTGLSSIHSQVTCPGFSFSPWPGCVQEATDICFSLVSFTLMILPLTHSFSISKINGNIFKKN